MNPKLKVLLLIAILVCVILLALVGTKVISSLTGKGITGASIAEKTESNELDEFAKCLSINGAKMYGAFWCGHCQNQKSMFQDSLKFISYIECDPRGENSESELCLAKGIKGYPTWEINSVMYPGEASLARLAELSGCELNISQD